MPHLGPTASVVVARGNARPVANPNNSGPVPAFAIPDAGVAPSTRYRCRFLGCGLDYASTDGVRKHCRKKVRAALPARAARLEHH